MWVKGGNTLNLGKNSWLASTEVKLISLADRQPAGICYAELYIGHVSTVLKTYVF